MSAYDNIADIQIIGQTQVMITSVALIAASAATQVCDLAAVKMASEVQAALSHRAVEVVSLSSDASTKIDQRLNAYVDKSATFNLGGGDVGRPLGSGLNGARALANLMKADHFQFLGWDYLDKLTDACGKQTVNVDFINTAEHEISRIEFTFDHGRVITAKGWQRSLESGSLPLNEPKG